MTKKNYTPEINFKWCKKCGLCIAYCPKKVFEVDAFGGPVVKNAEECLGCRMCEYRCPDFAVTVAEV